MSYSYSYVVCCIRIRIFHVVCFVSYPCGSDGKSRNLQAPKDLAASSFVHSNPVSCFRTCPGSIHHDHPTEQQGEVGEGECVGSVGVVERGEGVGVSKSDVVVLGMDMNSAVERGRGRAYVVKE